MLCDLAGYKFVFGLKDIVFRLCRVDKNEKAYKCSQHQQDEPEPHIHHEMVLHRKVFLGCCPFFSLHVSLNLCLDLSFSYVLDLMTFKKDTITFSSNMIYGPLRVAWRVIYVYTTDFDMDTDKLMGL